MNSEKREELKTWIWACEQMSLYYEGKSKDGGCKLCATSLIIEGEECKECPWVKFDGIICHDFHAQAFRDGHTTCKNISQSKSKKDPWWFETRREKLLEWIAKYRKMLDNG